MWSLQQIQERLKAALSGHSSDHEIALGFTVGTAISILPTPGFNLLLGALFIAVYPRVNKLAVFGASALAAVLGVAVLWHAGGRNLKGEAHAVAPHD